VFLKSRFFARIFVEENKDSPIIDHKHGSFPFFMMSPPSNEKIRPVRSPDEYLKRIFANFYIDVEGSKRITKGMALRHLKPISIILSFMREQIDRAKEWQVQN
jgi:hypothetical protein